MVSHYSWPRSSLSLSYATSFYSLGDSTAICVLGTDRKLWLESGELANQPSGWLRRYQIDGNVGAFQPTGDSVTPDPILVLGTDRNLWLEHGPFETVPPLREQIDGNVAAFQALDANTVYVLGTDGNLWLEHSVNGKFGKVPPPREQVDGNVAAFQAFDQLNAYVLGTDGNLWLEYATDKWGNVPPQRQHVDGNVAAFFALDYITAYVLGTDGNLWLEHGGPFGTVPPPREHVDGNVAAFQPIDANTVYVLGTDGNLWLEHSVNGKFGQVPPPRQQVDGNVEDFQAIDANNIYVLGTDGNLWLEHSVNGKFGQVPPPREKVDDNVNPPVAFSIPVRPAYQILTVVYAPPGTNGGKSTSEVDYSTGSSTGTTTSTSSSFKDGIDVSATVTAGPITANADFNFSKTTTDSSSVECKKSESYDIKLNGPAADGINHDDDIFYLWLNPILYVTVDRKNNVNWELGIDGPPPMEIQWVSVAGLKNPNNPNLMSPGTKKLLDAAGLAQSDYANILSTNPLASGPSAIDLNRYWPLTQSFPYEPPIQASDPVPTETYTVQNSVTNTSTHTEEVQYGVSVSVSAGLKEPFSLSLKVTESFQWTNTNSQSQQTESSQSASVTIGGPAFGYTGPTDLLAYWDSVYSTFMFAFPSSPPSATGLIVDQLGKPVAHKPVTLAVGTNTLTGFTDSKGEYRFYQSVSGQGKLSVEGKDFVVSVGPGAAKATLRLT